MGKADINSLFHNLSWRRMLNRMGHVNACGDANREYRTL